MPVAFGNCAGGLNDLNFSIARISKAIVLRARRKEENRVRFPYITPPLVESAGGLVFRNGLLSEESVPSVKMTLQYL